MPYRRCAAFASLAALLAGGACAPEAPPPSPLGEHLRPQSQQLVTEYDDRVVGAQQAQAAAAQYGLVADEKASAYVDAVGQRLARQAPGDFEYRFAIVNQPEPNAFALPGGYVFVTRGLLLLVNSEDELANVLGHEITHVAERHAAMQQAVASAPQLRLPKLVQVAGEGVDLANGQLGMSPRAWLAQYSRDDESDADRIGQQIAARAGWSPQGMGDFLTALESDMRLHQGEPRAPTFLDSHPSNPDRITAAAMNAGMLPRERGTPIAASRADFLAELDGLVVGDDPGEGVFQKNLFLQPDLGFALAFPEGWETQNTHTAVAAASPTRDVELLFEGQGPGTDARAAAEAFFASAPAGAELVRKGGAPEEIAGLPAWREQVTLRASGGVLDLDITWMVFGGNIYRATAVGQSVALSAQAPAIRGFAGSLRPLEPAERQGLRVVRLRSAPARAGESLEAFSARTGNTWKPSELALANGLFSDATLQEGQLLKIAVTEAYVPAPPAAR